MIPKNLILFLFLMLFLLNYISMKETQTFKLLDDFKIQLGDGDFYSVSFSHSKIISSEESNLTDIYISDDDLLLSKKYKSGKIGKKYFKFEDNYIDLNYVFYNDSNQTNYLGMAREVEYDKEEIKEKYDLSFIGQLKNKKEIDKYYIYFTPFLKNNGAKMPNPYFLIGALPSIFQSNSYKNKTSYAPLNPKYPTKWSTRISHILFETDSSLHKIPLNCDVIFTESGNDNFYIPYKYKSILDEIFISYYTCTEESSAYKCPMNSHNFYKMKLYLVFNGFSHLLSRDLIFSLKNAFYTSKFVFKKDLDYIVIDTYAMGNYHKLYNGENNMVMWLNLEEGAITDESDIYGYEDREGIKRIIYDPEYLYEWEQKLQNESKKINETIEELEILKKELNESKIKIEEEKKELEEEIEKYKKDIIRQEIDIIRKEKNDLMEEMDNLRNNSEKDKDVLKKEIDNLRDDLKKREEDNKALNEKIINDNNLMGMIIAQIVISVITVVLIFFCFSRAKKLEKQNQDFNIDLVDK